MEPLKRIVFSKQCDYDHEMFPFWWHWYRQVFKADLIVITPVRTVLASTDLTERIYGENGAVVIPIVRSDWNAMEIWNRQRQIMMDIRKPGARYVCVSADADQFFQYIPDSVVDGLDAKVPALSFRRIMITDDAPPSVERMRGSGPLSWACRERGRSAGFISDIDHRLVACTGHISKNLKTNHTNLFEFHYGIHGLDHFREKVKRINVDPASTASRHWKKWRVAFDHKGEKGLKAAYDECKKIDSGDSLKVLEQFRKAV